MQVNWLPEPDNHPLWPAIRDLLKPAADYGQIPVRDEDELIWIAHEGGVIFGAATTLLWNDGEAEIRLGAGTRLREWIGSMEAVVSAWARSSGARRLTMRGRKGWARFARAFGWVALGQDEDGLTIYEKAL